MFRKSPKGTTEDAPAVAPLEPLVPVDRFLGSEAARQFALALAERRYDDLMPILAACTTIAERAWVVQAAADDAELAQPLRGWCSAQPQSGLAAAAWGASLVVQAWTARTGRRAEHVSAEQFQEFLTLLRAAEAQLHQAASMSPSSPLPWLALLRSGRGLQISKYELRLRYDQAMRRNAPGLDASLQMLQALCEKWYGSHEEMFEFARGISAAEPAGSPLHAVLAMAHIERGIEGDSSVAAYLPTVADEIRGIGQRCVDHPAFVDSAPDGAIARNIMCFAYSYSGAHELAQRQRAALDGRLSQWPWGYLGAAAEVFRTASPRAGLVGG